VSLTALTQEIQQHIKPAVIHLTPGERREGELATVQFRHERLAHVTARTQKKNHDANLPEKQKGREKIPGLLER
jgi:hypothetical protein